MDLTRFTRIIEAYGSQPARWPAAERTAARQFAAEHNAARQLLDQHSQLDTYLQTDILATHEHLNLSRLEANLLAQVATIEQVPTIEQQTDNRSDIHRQAQDLEPRPRQAGLVAALDHFIAWLLPTQQQPTIIWRPTLLAVLPLIAGLLIGSNLQLDNLDYTDTWEDEVYLLALVPDATETLP
jgi:hypothetical protein